VINFKRTIVTSALPYANGSIHVGHLVEYIQTDIFVRFLKLIGEDAVYCCADDTHGAPIAIKAEQLKIIPEELIAKFHKEHQTDFKSFLIDFDSYYTTNSKENKYFSDLIFNRLNEKGHIYTKDVEVTYCKNCKRNLPDRYVKGKCPKCGAEDQYGDVCEKCNATYNTVDLIDPYCTICKNTPERKPSKHYFFKLSAFSDKLNKWLDKNKKLQPEIVNYVKNWIKEGLQDWDISRDGPYFGFKIPGEENKYYYVWLDAPIGYISSYANYIKKDVKKAEKDWNNSKVIHFIGKDIIYFHFLFWPAMLIGADFTLPESLIVHGFLTVKGEKMSKSRGTFLTAKEFLQDYNPEYLRFYYAKVLSKKMSDVNLAFDDFTETINNEIVANIANFCYRVLSFTNKFFNSEVKEIDDSKIIADIKKSVKKVKESYNDVNTNQAIKGILHISTLGNRYFQDNEPWKLIKTDKEKAHKVIGLCVNIVKNLSILLNPILPKFCEEIQKQLRLKNLKWDDIDFEFKNKKINKAKIIINKLEETKKTEEKQFPLDLKVAKIVNVKDHPDADKLYIIDIDLGKEKRVMVSSLKDYYTKEELSGKKIIVVTNLKKAKFRGIESHAMLLAVEDKNDCGLLYVEKANPGDIVRFGDLKNSSDTIEFDRFKKIKMKAKKGKIIYDRNILKVNNEEVKVDKFSDGEVC